MSCDCWLKSAPDHDGAESGQTAAMRERNGTRNSITFTLRIDTQAEIDYVQRGGILPYALEGVMA